MVSPDRLQKQMDLRGLLVRVSPSLLLEMKLGSMLSRINTLLSPSTFLFEETRDEQSRFARTMMSDIFENQLDELESERDLSNLEEIYLYITRLQLRLHCLQDRENPATSLQQAKLGIAASSIIDLIERLDTKTSLVMHCPHYIYRMTALTAAVLLRLAKQPEPQATSHESQTPRNASSRYKSYFFRTIPLLRSMSIDSNDMPSRMAKIFSQLWTIDKLFEQQPNRSLENDDVNDSSLPVSLSPPIVVQSRLSMSVLHDCMWRWKHHFRYSASSRNLRADHSLTTNDHRGSTVELISAPQQLHMPGMNSIASNLIAAQDESSSFMVPSASSISIGPSMGNPDNNLTPSFIQDFSPLATLPWDANMNEEFEMMADHFPESWPI